MQDSINQIVPVLFARSDSIYKSFPVCDVYDIHRDAKTWEGGRPAIAHPPCRSWGMLAQFAKPAAGEKELAIWAVDQIRKFGGVLEHPAGSKLWQAAGLPAPGHFDEFGGFTTALNQHWFGHRAEKATLLYIVGTTPRNLPAMPLEIGEPSHVVTWTKRPEGSKRTATGRPCRPRITLAEREHTPPDFAKFLIEIALSCRPIN